MADSSGSKGPVALIVGVAAAAVAVAIVAVVAINRDNNSATLNPVVTPSSVAPQTSSATLKPYSGVVPTPDPAQDTTACKGQAFGSPLGSLNAPANLHTYSASPPMTIDTSKLYRAVIITPKGNIVLCLEPALAPKTVNNFVTLARNQFYDGLVFHRVVPGFVIQGGDPEGTGSGGPGYQFSDETVKGQYTIGAVAMANSGPNTNGSQFFIDIADDTGSLQPKYNLFGYVEGGQDVANGIAQGDVMTNVIVQQQS